MFVGRKRFILSRICFAKFEICDQKLDFHNIFIIKRYYNKNVINPAQVKGLGTLKNQRLNKDLAFSLEERQTLGLHGLLPPRFKTQEEQLELCKLVLKQYSLKINKYIYLTELHDMNERLFFRLICENVTELMPIVYTPTVGLACQRYGLLYRRPRGLFLTINDKGYCYDVLKNWPEQNIKAVCITDGERILGLGDLGACGMCIPAGKLGLYTVFAGIHPHYCLPITLDVGTNNKEFLEDPLYIGLRQKRVTGAVYEEFVDEVMASISKLYGQNTLIQFEDLANHNAFHFLEKYRNQYCVFNDDIQGTAGAGLAGLIAASRILGKKLSDHKYLYLGAGEASVGIANLSVRYMVTEGTNEKEAHSKIWMYDIDGLLTKNRKLYADQNLYAKDHAPCNDFSALVKELKPTVLIGASTVPSTFTPEILTDMAHFNERPIIFPLSNPTHKSECSAEEAFKYTEGRVLFASGSPMPPVELKGKKYYPSQGNNAYVYPGVALGTILSGMRHISDDVFVIAAIAVADNLTKEHIDEGRIYPPLTDIQKCSISIAIKLFEYAYSQGIASVYPEPKDKKQYIESRLYSYMYDKSLPLQWTWPEPPKIMTKPLKQTLFKLW